MSEKKVDILSTKQKWQQEEGQFQAISNFDRIKEDKLTWVEALFNDGKVKAYGENSNRMEFSCQHGEKELMCEEM
jgi:hypothetical protein